MIPGYDEWKTTPPDEPEIIPDIQKDLNGPGYVEFGTLVFVPDEDACSYALERISSGTEEEKKEFVDWFYSGGWIREG